ncbi:MAG: 2-oxoglutarate dehydrogenase E1 component [Saprospiraceae bacterium]|nr:2-oxoglutarate dehydrogenase E1 component [Saprospiraceae bacterium]
MKDYSYVFNAHPDFIENLYRKYQASPDSVEEGWRTFFKGFDFARNGVSETAIETSETGEDISKEFGVFSIINGFRSRGHLLSTTNPIRERRDRRPHLDLSDYNLSEEDLDKVFVAGQEIGLENATLKEILDRLHKIYSGNIGFEYAHIEDREKRNWLKDQIENRSLDDDYGLDLETKRRILEKLNGAVVFEKFLHTKYVGQKRFSLEGGETTIAALDAMINEAVDADVKEVVIGMAHRGRLNVLANIMKKTYEQIFTEFEGNMDPDLSFGDGDVKYHLGFSSEVPTSNGKMVNLQLAPNPSHLESVNTVVQGYSRAKADCLYGRDYDQILPVLLHGDAAIAGQGIMYETVQMSQLEGYYSGGTLHFVINNQIGFTTDFDDARSSTYCTGVASLVQAPVFHVNGDDPEAVVKAMQIAVAYRQKFNNDVFIDMVCYRKHGHNEGDDPKFTQPQMYEIIKKHPDPRKIYADKLVSRGDLEAKIAEELEDSFWQELQERLDQAKEKPLPYKYQSTEEAWMSLKQKATPEDFERSPVTGIEKETVDKILDHIMSLPNGFNPLSKVNRLLKSAKKTLDDNKVDWALAELSAYASLLIDGHDVRMSGQDVKRGTFSHRHAVFHDAETFEEFNRLSGMTEDQGRFMIYNSLLSEFGVLGFEYGYSLATPQSLVLWEAQFGDFYNGAQVIVDQFISASESKWGRNSGLVMLLPHGYAGQGPEHSSSRLERFLQLCAELNMSVINCTKPANFFHALRRQLVWPFRKPLIVMSPKSLLRHPECVSPIEDLSGDRRFQEVLDDPLFEGKKKKKVRRLLVCSGKFYYDLTAYRKENEIEDVAIVRLEQIYPIPTKQLENIISSYDYSELIWTQEEPSNMGAWQFIAMNLPQFGFSVISRKASASPATGYKKVHDKNQKALVEASFANETKAQEKAENVQKKEKQKV